MSSQSTSIRFAAWVAESIRALNVLPADCIFEEMGKDLAQTIGEQLSKLNVACAVSLPSLSQASQDDRDEYRVEVTVMIDRNTNLSQVDSYAAAETILAALKGRQFEDSASDWVYHQTSVSKLTHKSTAGKAIHTLTVSAPVNI